MLAGQGSGKEQIYFRYWMHRAHRHDNPAHFGIRTERYKLTFYYGLPLDVDGASKAESPCGWELYDLQEDPEELQNIYETAGVELRKTLQQQLEKARQFYGDTDEQYPELLERYTQPSKE